MIYIKSFIRRLRIKSALYFSLLPALIVGLLNQSFYDCISFSAIMTLTLYFLAHLINVRDYSSHSQVLCRICGFDSCSLLYPARKKRGEKGSFACSSFDNGKYSEIFYCPSCKNGFLKNIGTEKYTEHCKEGLELYKDVVDEEYIKNLSARKVTNRKLVSDYAQYFKEKDVFEIGAYYGAFCGEVKEIVKSYTGLEPSLHAYKYLKERHPGCDFINGTTEDLNNGIHMQKEQFDTIVMYDVIEHIPDPIATLRTLHQYLRPNGTIIFSTINIESTFSLMLGPFWPWFMDMHYYYFSDRGYVDMLHRSGYIMRKHLHFSYYVYLSYFVRKSLSILIGPFTLPKSIESKMQFPIKICFGDTVMIIGEKREC